MAQQEFDVRHHHGGEFAQDRDLPPPPGMRAMIGHAEGA